jgi:N-acetyl-gamma-glutamylphosphate reductase
MIKMIKIFVIGETGYIGSEILIDLLRKVI